jgi:GR25 family glycosyltransferase involved in LPS biosynthesis
MDKELNADRLTKIYVKIREARRDLAKKDKELEDQLNLVAQQLLEICREQGAATIRTEHGTVSRRSNKRFWPTDWDAFYKFIKEHDAMSLLFQRINTSNMEQFLEENPDLQPPGLNADVTQTVVITKR